MGNRASLEIFGTTTVAALTLSTPVLLFLCRGTRQGLAISLSFAFVILSSVAWFTLVSQALPRPYLDEIFHIPQVQKYCEGRFLEWDDKITTPPGLYLFSIVLQGAAQTIAKPWLSDCGPSSLRFTNVLGLTALASLALLCRHEIESRLHEAHASGRLRRTSAYAVHTALNIALFPLLFFFSGLYYTDVLSTAVVMGAFLNHLKRVGRDHNSWTSDVMTTVLGIATLFMRQTNVFWVVVFMGGLEAAHAIKTLRPERVDQPFMVSLSEQLKFYAWRYSVGDVHDLPLKVSWPDDMLYTAISFAIAALCNPIRVLRQIWPYIFVLIAFAGFVTWNGGVVLGDKSNHVATIHLAQILYIWPFFAFFSLPLILPYVISLLNAATTLCRQKARQNDAANNQSSSASPASLKQRLKPSKAKAPKPADRILPHPDDDDDDDDPSPGKVSSPLRIVSRLFNDTIFIWILYILATIILSVGVVKYNTIIHPFTLADNRHYMFYIFRYTIRRGALVRYLLIVPYTLSRWMVWGTFAGCSDWVVSPRTNMCFAQNSTLRPSPFTSRPFWIGYGSKKRQTGVAFPKDMSVEPASPPSETIQLQSLEGRDPLVFSAEPVSASTGLIFLLATSLSLITAPLVEPRYFIIPWVMWRLLVPAWRLHDQHPVNGRFEGISAESCTSKVVALLKCYDVRLVLETIWLMAINIVTGYIFLAKAYVWRDENGSILDEGRLQRFMW